MLFHRESNYPYDLRACAVISQREQSRLPLVLARLTSRLRPEDICDSRVRVKGVRSLELGCGAAYWCIKLGSVTLLFRFARLLVNRFGATTPLR